MINQCKNKLTRRTPGWQSKKMRLIIAQRWLETWEVVETRDIEKKNLLRLYQQWCQKDSC